MKKFQKVFIKTETRLVLFLGYVGSLIYVLLNGQGLRAVVEIHLFFVFLFSMFYFGRQFVWFFISPVIAIYLPIQNYLLKRYLKQFKENVPAEVVVVLGRYNWYMLEAWIKPNFFKREIKALVKLLQKNGQNFSFYSDANFKDVGKIMGDKSIKEVYFFGHGDSHTFQLNTDEILYYCEFNNSKYEKEFVHHVHCGTIDGKSLIDYVVPEKNRAKCFLFRKTITGEDIVQEFKRRTKDVRVQGKIK
ncbi:MAG: hypothetical protein NTW06_03990 [Candidatus Falkowbacteria bacterium]|nr:hypothetical protein [Candidatus Falkowbacteria bacterium]